MATGSSTFMGLGMPLFGEANMTGATAANDILTMTGASGQTGDFLVCESSAGAEGFVVSSTGRIATMVLGTVALATLASNASATVALTGITTACIANIFARGDQTGAQPIVWASAADKLGYGAPGVACAAQTVNVWYFATA